MKKCLPHYSKYENKFYYIGAMTGFVLSSLLFLGFYAFNYTNPETFNKFVNGEANGILLKYIEGKWVSAVEDVFVTVDIHDSNEIVIVETISNKKSEKRFFVKNIKKIDSVLGIVVLEISDEDSNSTLIQINKVFGVNNTITLLYDSKVASCKNIDDECIRAFKRIKNI